MYILGARMFGSVGSHLEYAFSDGTAHYFAVRVEQRTVIVPKITEFGNAEH